MSSIRTMEYHLEKSCSFGDIYENIPSNEFSFKDVSLSMNLRIGGSSDKNGLFNFENEKQSSVRSFYVEDNLELY